MGARVSGCAVSNISFGNTELTGSFPVCADRQLKMELHDFASKTKRICVELKNSNVTMKLRCSSLSTYAKRDG